MDLKDEMEALHFRMPSLSGQDTKKLQLTALQEVRDNAVGAYKSLSDRANLVKRMITSKEEERRTTVAAFMLIAAKKRNLQP